MGQEAEAPPNSISKQGQGPAITPVSKKEEICSVKPLKKFVNPYSSTEKLTLPSKRNKCKRSKERKSEPVNNEVAVEEAQSKKRRNPQVEVVKSIVSPSEKQSKGANVTPKKTKIKLFKEEQKATSIPTTPMQKEKASENLTSSQIQRHIRSMSRQKPSIFGTQD